MDAMYEVIFSGSTATVYENGAAVKSFYFRFAIFSKEKKNVLIPSYLYDSKDDWNHTALTLINAMIDRTSGGYWLELLSKYKEGSPCEAIETVSASEDEKNTLRVMVSMMNLDYHNVGLTDNFVTEYLKRLPASEMPNDQLEALFNRCYLTIV